MTETATFAAGCFWQVQEAFIHIKGVLKTTVGYTGGDLDNPTYDKVCSDKTNHAEAVQIEFNSKIVSYEKLLEIFWNNHDPTTVNRQGPDIGSQYRSVIFYHSPAQKTAGENSKNQLDQSGKYQNTVVTQITAAKKFFPAEDYHQQYLHKRGLSNCQV